MLRRIPNFLRLQKVYKMNFEQKWNFSLEPSDEDYTDYEEWNGYEDDYGESHYGESKGDGDEDDYGESKRDDKPMMKFKLTRRQRIIICCFF